MAQIESEIFTRGIVKDGKFVSFRPQTEQKWLDANEGKELVRIYRPVVEQTTTDQHGYLRGVIIRMCCMNSDRFAGWDEEEIYNYFVDTYFYIPVIKTMNGKSIEFKKKLSMATAGKRRSAEFITRIIQDLAEDKECPIVVPEPGETILNKYSSINRGEKTESGRNPGSSGDPEKA
jgi:hypothetical protein